MEHSKTQRLVVTAIFLALATVLSFIKVLQMPLGGSVTLLSMLPLVLLSLKYGVKWGAISAFGYALIQFAIDLPKIMSWGLTPQSFIGSIIFDYLIAFTVIGFAGMFKKKGTLGVCIGVGLTLAARYLCHVISGSFIFDIWCPDGWNVYLYAFCYNGLFMLPELVFTLIGSVVVLKVPFLKKQYA